jgi:hypothetical protein
MGRQNFVVEWATISLRSIKIFILIFVLAVSFLVYWFWLREKPSTQTTEPTSVEESAARFVDYEGKVEVKPKDEFVWKNATFKMELREGDRIRTAPDSLAKIVFDDGTEITVQSDSIVVISKSVASKQTDQNPLMVIEIGESDVNAEKSASAPSVSTERITRFELAPGSKGSVIADMQTGEHSGTVDKGVGVLTDREGRKTSLTDLEQVKIDKNNLTTRIKLPYTPPLLSPPTGQVFDFLSDQGLTIELKWRDVSNAAKYHVQISETPLFGKLSAENAGLTKSFISIKIPKTSKKQYFWRVRSIDKKNNRSPWSESNQFVVQSPNTSTVKSLDKTPPVLQISYMHPFLPFVQVEGKTEQDAFLTLNGQIIDVKEDGSFVFTYTLQQSGWNDLVFLAEDPAGNKSTVTKRVEYK